MGDSPTLLSRTMAQTSHQKQGPVASQMQPTVVAIETFPLMLGHLQQTSVGNEPKKSPLQYAAGFVEIESEVSPRLSDGE